MGVPTLRPTDLPTCRSADLPNSILPTHPVVHHHVDTRAALPRRTGEVFDPIRTDASPRASPAATPSRTRPAPMRTYESRRTTGRLLLLP